MIPAYEPVILEHRDGHYLIRDHMGATVEIADSFDPSYLQQAKDFVTRKWHKFPVENREDWLEMKKRYDPEAPERFSADFPDQCLKWRSRGTLLTLFINGAFWQLREWCGFENLCIMMVEDPDLVHEMADFWTGFMAEMLKKITSRVELDFVVVAEDMAYKAHAMISPQMTREFILGAYNAWIPIIKQSGCPIIELDSDGCVNDLIPIWIESGINCNSPVEVAAHCDILEYRRRYGKDISFKQGIDKRIIARGGQELEQHVMGIVPEMFKLGGYIPGCDHGVPPDISWKNYVEFGRLIAKLSGWL
jgi:uroporphyrinogen decarboxylase